MEKKLVDELDLDTVFRVAENELGRIGAESRPSRMRDAVLALGKAYLWSYDDMGPELFIEPIYKEALAQVEDAEFFGVNVAEGTTAEFVCGRALAVAAWRHAEADINLCHGNFADRAVDRLQEYDLAPVGEGWRQPLEERAVGVDMSRRAQSAQAITVGQVKEFVLENLEYDWHATDAEKRAAALILQPQDFDALASGLMDSYRDIEYDRGDVDWLVEQAMEIARTRPGFEEEVVSCQEAIGREEGGEELEDEEPDLENEGNLH